MSVHPENSPETNELFAKMGQEKMTEVFCVGCQCKRPMNALYAQYVKEIKNCRHCR